jgi:hypothetical protein
MEQRLESNPQLLAKWKQVEGMVNGNQFRSVSGGEGERLLIPVCREREVSSLDYSEYSYSS